MKTDTLAIDCTKLLRSVRDSIKDNVEKTQSVRLIFQNHQIIIKGSVINVPKAILQIQELVASHLRNQVSEKITNKFQIQALFKLKKDPNFKDLYKVKLQYHEGVSGDPHDGVQGLTSMMTKTILVNEP